VLGCGFFLVLNKMLGRLCPTVSFKGGKKMQMFHDHVFIVMGFDQFMLTNKNKNQNLSMMID